MALEMMDEHERGESVRAWLRQNGGAIVTGVAIGLTLIFGWQWYQRSKIEHRVAAATQYQALTDAVERKDAELVASLSEELAKNYADTPYAALAALQRPRASSRPTTSTPRWPRSTRSPSCRPSRR
jgi:predicted negative regulator of RcsB-dependent stress response